MGQRKARQRNTCLLEAGLVFLKALEHLHVHVQSNRCRIEEVTTGELTFHPAPLVPINIGPMTKVALVPGQKCATEDHRGEEI